MNFEYSQPADWDNTDAVETMVCQFTANTEWSPAKLDGRSNPCTYPTGGYYQAGSLKNHCDLNHFWSFHNGGANFVWADGSVRFIPFSARSRLDALATRSNGDGDP